MAQSKNVIICTEKRGVIFGALKSMKPIPGTALYRVKLTNARQCIYWHQSIKGVFGLASTGPNAQCRVGAAVPALEDTAHAILDVTAEAAKAWESAPWA